MKVTTYLAITLLSVSLEFAVMEILQTSQKLKNETVDLNNASLKKRFRDLMKDLGNRARAIPSNAVIEKNNISTIILTNSSITDISLKSTTESPIDLIFYDENISTTEDTFTSEFTTELEYDNVTEIALFEKKNTSLVKPSITLKKAVVTDCHCNLLYKVCDINCCCDIDCTETQLKMFTCIDEPKARDVSCEISHTLASSFIAGVENLFCVAKTNLPEHRIVNNYKHDPYTLSKSLKWHASNRERNVPIFEKKYYKYGDFIWVLSNGSVYYIDLPATVTNNFCTDRKPMKFLQNVQMNCNVDIEHLEQVQILSTSDYKPFISVTEKSLNSSALNCTTLHCTNWTIFVCDNENVCVTFDKKLHEPFCTDFLCKNVALRVDYLFYYYDSKITNVTIKFYIHNLPLKNPFFAQQVNVKFVLANECVDQIISLSGNPGYISGLPVVVSYAEGNHTDSFYNTTSNLRYLPHLENTKGICTTPSLDKKFVLFGVNQRIKCRYADLHRKVTKTATELCENIQKNIKLLLLQSKKMVVSPFGNPRDVLDSEWITMSNTNTDSAIFGEINSQKTKLLCYNLLVRASYIFTYADASESEGKTKNKILSAKVETTERNVTLNAQDLSVVLTLDTVFIDESMRSVYQYAAGPQLNIHLPKDFFFPFRNNSITCKCNVFVIMFACVLSLISK